MLVRTAPQSLETTPSGMGSFEWYLMCTGNDDWDDMIYDEPDSDLGKHKMRSAKGYYGYMLGRGNRKITLLMKYMRKSMRMSRRRRKS